MLAPLLMLFAAIVYGAYPAVAHQAASRIDPTALVAGAHALCAAVALALFWIAAKQLGWQPHRLFRDMLRERGIRRTAITNALLDALCHALLIAAFAVGERYVTAMVYATWPILASIMLPLLLSGRVGRGKPMPLVLSLIGVVIVQAGTSGDFTGVSIQGLLLAGLATIIMAASASIVVLAEEKIDKTCPSTHRAAPVARATLPTMAAIAIIRALSALGATIAFFALGGGNALATDVAPGFAIILVAAAGLIMAAGSVLFIVANKLSTTSSVNLIWNTEILFAPAFLFLLDMTDPPAVTLYVGGAVILAANVLVTLQSIRQRSKPPPSSPGNVLSGDLRAQ